MTPEDLEFVRACKFNVDHETTISPGHCNRLLTLLIEAEAMRRKAEHRASPHRESANTMLGFSGGIECYLCSLTDPDWISAVRKEIEV